MPADSFINNQLSKEFSVSEISIRIKETLENNFGYVRVRGELSGVKIAASGHAYFNLKDHSSIIGCTCWKHILTKIKFALNDGIEVVVLGKITAYAGQSKYQISVEMVEPAGAGAMMQILKERRAQLEKEGLFDQARKKTLPFFPAKIGVITSLTGAVIKDIIHRISDRCPTNIIIWPVSVQGENAPGEITKAIDEFNKLPKNKIPDVLIIARGGGSIEDLWAFNEESVIRAVYASIIPIISAVGHETDYTLIDLVADVRAPTPTAAAEFAVPIIANLQYTLNYAYNNLYNRILGAIRLYSQNLLVSSSILMYHKGYIENYQQKIDELEFRFKSGIPSLLSTKSTKLSGFSINRLSPVNIFKYKALQLMHLATNLLTSSEKLTSIFETTLSFNSSLLESLSYHNVLKRGFAIVKSEEGNFLSSAALADRENKMNIKFYDGQISVKKL